MDIIYGLYSRCGCIRKEAHDDFRLSTTTIFGTLYITLKGANSQNSSGVVLGPSDRRDLRLPPSHITERAPTSEIFSRSSATHITNFTPFSILESCDEINAIVVRRARR